TKYSRYDGVAVGDVTGDGIPDVFVGGPDAYQVWHGNGDGHFSAKGQFPYR
ncbi:MAG: VCBS repeat-containing protein, partial [Anaerolineae bacterium]|nr:VCBS repeat-containing protein [Anaerolineae bacterium]